MDMNINFPNLHIYADYVIKSIPIGNFDIALYGICIGIGIIVGLLLVRNIAKKTGQNPDDYIDLAIAGVVFGIIGARIYYVAFSWDWYKTHLSSIFDLRQGGLGIYGGVIAAILTAIVYSKRKKQPFFKVADTACVGLLAGQIIGRWGNYFNREAFGGYTDNLFAMQLPVSAVRQQDITAELADHILTLNGVEYIQVHPTFLYESLWNLAVLLVLLAVRKYTKFHGEIFLMYMLGYGIGRFFIESLRTDQLLIAGYPVSKVLAAAVAIVSFILLVALRKGAGKNKLY